MAHLGNSLPAGMVPQQDRENAMGGELEISQQIKSGGASPPILIFGTGLSVDFGVAQGTSFV